MLVFHHYLSMVLVFLAIYTMSKAEQHITICVLVATASIVSLNAMLWIWYGTPEFLRFLGAYNISYMFAEELLSRNRAFLPFLMPAILGGYLTMLIPLGIMLHQKYYKNEDIPLWKRPLQNSLLLIPGLLMLAALLLTKSIGPLLSLLLSIIIVLFAHKAPKGKSLVIILCLAGAVLLMLILLRSHNVGYWRKPFFSLAQRQLYWANTLTVIRRFFWFGTGPGNMPFVGSQFSHNSYLQIWAESGLLALLSFLNIVFYILNKNLRNKTLARPLGIWIWISVFSFLLHNLIDFTFFLSETALIWWGILALLGTKQHA